MQASCMNVDLAEVHGAIGRELMFLYTKWNYYKQLYCTDDKTVRLLNGAAEFFFGICDEVLRDDMILTICRLTDPASTVVQKQKRDNLTFAQLIALVPKSDNVLVSLLQTELVNLNSLSADIRTHRNRRIGHTDLNTRIRRATNRLPAIGFKYMDDVLAKMADILNAIESHFDHNSPPYEHGIMGRGQQRI